MTTQIILSKLTNLVIPDEIIFEIDKKINHAKHAVHHGEVMDELILFVDMVSYVDLDYDDNFEVSDILAKIRMYDPHDAFDDDSSDFYSDSEFSYKNNIYFYE